MLYVCEFSGLEEICLEAIDYSAEEVVIDAPESLQRREVSHSRGILVILRSDFQGKL